jgi:transcriptional regulator with XRE-family HTH domain
LVKTALEASVSGAVSRFRAKRKEAKRMRDLRFWRFKRRLSLEALSRLTDLSLSKLRRFEIGRYVPDEKEQQVICRALQINDNQISWKGESIMSEMRNVPSMPRMKWDAQGRPCFQALCADDDENEGARLKDHLHNALLAELGIGMGASRFVRIQTVRPDDFIFTANDGGKTRYYKQSYVVDDEDGSIALIDDREHVEVDGNPNRVPRMPTLEADRGGRLVINDDDEED